MGFNPFALAFMDSEGDLVCLQHCNPTFPTPRLVLCLDTIKHQWCLSKPHQNAALLYSSVWMQLPLPLSLNPTKSNLNVAFHPPR